MLLDLVHDRLSVWEDGELRLLAKKLKMAACPSRETCIEALAKVIVDSREGLRALNTVRAAGMVGTVVTERWRAAHVQRWVRDAAGRPVPWARGAEHQYVVSYRSTTPSGRNRIGCTSCAMKLTDVPGGDRACPGSQVQLAAYAIGQAIEGGVVYSPDTSGLPLPEPGLAVACLRCWRFGPWTKVDHAARQTVCDACFELPFPTATTTMRLGRARSRP